MSPWEGFKLFSNLIESSAVSETKHTEIIELAETNPVLVGLESQRLGEANAISDMSTIQVMWDKLSTKIQKNLSKEDSVESLVYEYDSNQITFAIESAWKTEHLPDMSVFNISTKELFSSPTPTAESMRIVLVRVDETETTGNYIMDGAVKTDPETEKEHRNFTPEEFKKFIEPLPVSYSEVVNEESSSTVSITEIQPNCCIVSLERTYKIPLE